MSFFIQILKPTQHAKNTNTHNHTSNVLLQGTGTLTVSVTNVNDNTPTFGQSVYDASVAESQASGTSVAQLAATDGDVTSSLSYAIASGNVPDRFQFRLE